MPVNVSNDDNRYSFYFWGLLIASVITGLCFVFLRYIDLDEGLFLAAGHLISQGFSPYTDFFFPQMPMQPLIIAPLSGFGLNSLFLTRLLAVLCHILMSLLIYNFSRHLSHSKKTQLTMFFIILFSGPILTWSSLAKVYFLCNLFLVGSFVVITLLVGRRQLNYLQLFIGFILLSFAINIRAIFIVLIPLYFFVTIFVFQRHDKFSYWKFILVVLLGLIFPSLYSLKLFIQSPDSFFFNNLGFHLLREQAPGFWAVILNKLYVLAKVIIQPHYLILIITSIWSLLIINQRRWNQEHTAWQRMIPQFAIVIAILITVIYLIPNPVLVQYFNQPLIFLIIASYPAIELIISKAKSFRLSFIAIYALSFLIYPFFYIAFPRENAKNYTVNQVRRVVKEIRNNSSPDDTVLSEWVGHNVFAERKTVKQGELVGYQLDFGNALVPYNKYQLLTDNRINTLLSRQEPKLVVINNYVIDNWKKELERNYDLLVKLNSTFIYDRKTGADIE